MKSVFKQNKELTFLKEEFKIFVEKKNKKDISKKEQIEIIKVDELVLEETI